MPRGTNTKTIIPLFSATVVDGLFSLIAAGDIRPRRKLTLEAAPQSIAGITERCCWFGALICCPLPRAPILACGRPPPLHSGWFLLTKSKHFSDNPEGRRRYPYLYPFGRIPLPRSGGGPSVIFEDDHLGPGCRGDRMVRPLDPVSLPDSVPSSESRRARAQSESVPVEPGRCRRVWRTCGARRGARSAPPAGCRRLRRLRRWTGRSCLDW